jgi:hypothetical protein
MYMSKCACYKYPTENVTRKKGDERINSKYQSWAKYKQNYRADISLYSGCESWFNVL